MHIKHSLPNLLNKRHTVPVIDPEEIFIKHAGHKRTFQAKTKYPKVTRKKIMQQPWDERFINDFIREVAND